ncbi:MAG TPA: hypothetical protein VN971_12325 [Thermoanaerobaculia bacterium]|nr:hypothetical protein [Thermoanaerobaculia bacterium]
MELIAGESSETRAGSQGAYKSSGDRVLKIAADAGAKRGYENVTFGDAGAGY